MEEYEAQIRCRFPRVVLVQSRTPGPEVAGDVFDAFLVPPERLGEFRAFVATDLAALAARLRRPTPVINVHGAEQERLAEQERTSQPPAEWR
jgi:hypothetical protein